MIDIVAIIIVIIAAAAAASAAVSVTESDMKFLDKINFLCK